MALSWWQGLALLRRAQRERERDRAWQMYCALYPHMKPISFEQFFRLPQEERQTRDTAKVIELAERIKDADQRRVR